MMMEDYCEMFADSCDYLREIPEKWSSKDGIPKEKLFVKLVPGINRDDEAYVQNGIRQFFTEPLMQLLAKSDIEDSLSQVNKVFNILVYVIGAISLTIAFFLLLIATTQNVKEAIWEYGVLRSMGITKAEGKRIQMYEAYIVITSAAILGTLVGFLTSLAIATQF